MVPQIFRYEVTEVTVRIAIKIHRIPETPWRWASMLTERLVSHVVWRNFCEIAGEAGQGVSKAYSTSDRPRSR